MNKLLGTALMAATLSMTASPATADDQVREMRPVDARITRVKLGGVAELTVRQGATASLVVWGERRDVERFRTSQSGDTLQLDTENRKEINIGWRKHDLHAELTVPNLAEFVSQGVGGARVTGFSGDSIKLALDGAGSLTFDSRYRKVDARLGGVGGLTLDANNADSVELNLRGAGRITATGQAKTLRAHLAGVGSLEAQGLQADSVDLNVTGMGGAEVLAKTSARVNLSGMGSATVYGNPPTRSASTTGMGKVNWK